MKGFGWFLGEVEKRYPLGLVEFYDRMPNNPWQKNLDLMESEIIGCGNRIEAIEMATYKGLKKAKVLIEHFKAHGEPSKQISLHDAFQIGNPEKVSALESSIQGKCWSCGSEEDLSFEPSESGTVMVVCETHRARV